MEKEERERMSMQKRALLRRLMAALLALMMLGGLAAAFADGEVPEGYPAVRIDPQTGKPYDFGGQTVYIYNYWTGSNWDEEMPGTEYDRAVYLYRAWLQKTYNCKLVNIAKGDWGSIAEEMVSFVRNPDGSLCLFILPADFLGYALNANACAKWNGTAWFAETKDKWNSTIVNQMTLSGGVYGVSVGKTEPRQCLFFNKRVLTEAGVDWNALYDMQQAGTWTWTAFENILQKVHRDTDGDEIPDVFGFLGNPDDLYRIAVFSNGGSFIAGDADGRLKASAGNAQSLSALNWAKNLLRQYQARRPEDSAWDWYKDVWKEGTTAFYVGQAFSGFGDNSEMSDMADAWGCVAFPIGPSGSTYVTIASENVTVIPNVYRKDTINKLVMIYDLWTASPAGLSSEDDWIGNKYLYTDARAVDETYAMLRDPAHTVADKAALLGSINGVEGDCLLWKLDDSEMTLTQTLAYAETEWNQMIGQFNANYRPPFRIADYDKVLYLPEDTLIVESEAFAGTDAEVVVVPFDCQTIMSRAFADCPNLQYMLVPQGSRVGIAEDAFGGKDVTVIRE